MVLETPRVEFRSPCPHCGHPEAEWIEWMVSANTPETSGVLTRMRLACANCGAQESD